MKSNSGKQRRQVKTGSGSL